MKNNYKCEVYAHGAKIYEGDTNFESVNGSKKTGASLRINNDDVLIISYPMQKDNNAPSGLVIKFTKKNNEK